MADAHALEPIEQVTLGHLVSARLRDLIVEGRLAPGQRLVEARIADELNVSRSPVREALAELSREGLVESLGKRGNYVWMPTLEDVDEIISLRVMVEALAAEWLIRRSSATLLARLEALVGDQAQAAEQGDYRELVRLDRAFHDHMVRGAGHGRLTRIWEQLSGQWEVLIYHRLYADIEKVAPTVVSDHREMVRLIREGDLDGLVAKHRAANRVVRDELVASMASDSQTDAISLEENS